MADLSIDEALARLEGLPQKIADAGVDIMQSEAPVKTGTLKGSIHAEVSGDSIFIGSDIEHAAYVEYGRGEVRPKRAKALHWDDVFAMRSGPVAPNDFVGRTATRLQAMSFTL